MAAIPQVDLLVPSIFKVEAPGDILTRNNNSALLPIYACTLSVCGLLLHVLFRRFVATPTGRHSEIEKSNQKGRHISVKRFSMMLMEETSVYHGGKTIFCFMVARLAGCVALLGLRVVSVALLALRRGDHPHSLSQPFGQSLGDSNSALPMCLTYLYASVLACLSLYSCTWSPVTTRHTVFISLFTLAVYIYRDVWPLATYSLTPLDLGEGRIIWIEIAVLAVTAILIPLFIPRRAVPTVLGDTAEPLNPEQTASIFSLLTFSFVDPIFKSSYSDGTPEFPEYGCQCIIDSALSYLDPFRGARNRHLASGLLRLFKWDVITFIILSTVCTVAIFLCPLALYRLLMHLETNGDEAYIRPWFWVICIFITLCMDGVLHQLVLEQSMRLSSGKAPSVKATGPTSLEGSSASDASSSEPADNDINDEGYVNKFSKHIDIITKSTGSLLALLQVPLEIILSAIFFGQTLGYSVMAGFYVVLLFLHVSNLISTKVFKVAGEAALASKSRVQMVAEMVNSMRMIKLLGWEKKIAAKTEVKREEELSKLWNLTIWIICHTVLSIFISSFAILATLAAHTLPAKAKQDLSAASVFSCMLVLYNLQPRLGRMRIELIGVFQGKKSLDQINGILNTTELLDSFSNTSMQSQENVDNYHNEDAIGFKDADFTWCINTSDTSTPCPFQLHIKGHLYFKKGGINLIVGPSGCGKTSLLMALLGEMHLVPSNHHPWYNLPRSGGVAYVSQIPWIQNDTIRNNILSFSLFDETRYNKVVHQCALQHVFDIFEKGDQTEVGESGIMLSAEQKALAMLARALYSSAEILLLDDVLDKLDTHTWKWIVDKCFRGDLIGGRTAIITTRNAGLASTIASCIVSIDKDGTMACQNLESSLAFSNAFTIDTDDNVNNTEEDAEDTKNTSEKEKNLKESYLSAEERIQDHTTTFQAVKWILTNLAGNRTVAFFSVILIGIILSAALPVFNLWYLGLWTSQYETSSLTSEKTIHHLAIYAVISVASNLMISLYHWPYLSGTFRLSRMVHKQLMESLLCTTIRWIDTTPNSQIITRVMKDISVVHNRIPPMILTIITMGITGLTRFSIIVVFSPVFLIPGIVAVVLGFYVARAYHRRKISTAKQMRLMRSPLLAHFNSSIAGVSSIRAFSLQDKSKAEFIKRTDHYTRATKVYWDLDGWMGIRVDALGAFLSAALTGYLLYQQPKSPGTVGFLLILLISFSDMMPGMAIMCQSLETQMISLERIQEYSEIDYEPIFNEVGSPPPDSWPTKGSLKVEKLSARDYKNDSMMLHDISFHVQPGEKIGVVERRGNVKALLPLSLLRCISTEGNVWYDGLLTSSINLDILRSRMTFISRAPELLNGTLRRNLDPFEEYEDATLHDALRDAGLVSLHRGPDNEDVTLDSNILEDGNTSIIPQQTIAFARAIVQRSKLIIVEEGCKADSTIQAILRSNVKSDVTVVILIEHLRTIMEVDKIMVLDNGRLVEFDSPKLLLKKERGVLKSIIAEDGNEAELLGAEDESDLS